LVRVQHGPFRFGGIAFPFFADKAAGRAVRLVAVEPASCPTLTRGHYAYDYGDSAGLTPAMLMYTLGHDFVPPRIHAGGLRYHGDSPLVSQLVHDRLVEAIATGAHRVMLHGLSPATLYHYRLLSDGEPLGGDHVLSSAPSSASGPVRFSVLGDTGTGCEPELQVVDRVSADALDFVLVTGDVAYGSGTAEQVRDGWSIPFAPLLERVPVFPCLGNHGVDTRGGQPLFDVTVLPVNDSTGTSQFYSFDYGPLHVVALDSNGVLRPGHSQRDWLAADLAATTAPWRVVFFHHPAYSSSDHGSTGSVDTNLVPLFEAARVDLVFNGHDHDYERTFPMVNGTPAAAADEPDYVDPPGPLYVVTGGGGQHLYGAGTSAFTAVSASLHHHVTVDVSGSVLTLTATRTDGTTLDRMTITKTR